MDNLLKSLRQDYSALHFVAGNNCYWSSQDQTITYRADEKLSSIWGLLHELGHALLQHDSYKDDVDLLTKEVLAWNRAEELARTYGIAIEDAYIQNCLDTYRDWLHKRSTCPTCGVKTLAKSEHEYQCFNCSASWQVSPARHHRPYRRTKKIPH